MPKNCTSVLQRFHIKAKISSMNPGPGERNLWVMRAMLAEWVIRGPPPVWPGGQQGYGPSVYHWYLADREGTSADLEGKWLPPPPTPWLLRLPDTQSKDLEVRRRRPVCFKCRHFTPISLPPIQVSFESITGTLSAISHVSTLSTLLAHLVDSVLPSVSSESWG